MKSIAREETERFIERTDHTRWALVPVKEEEKRILAHLLELYEYEFSAYEDVDVNALGLYGYPYLDHYFVEPKRFAYFIKVEGRLAGFVMVCDHLYVSKDLDRLFLSEFFVLKKYRRKGLGRWAAGEVLGLHPGKWELTVHTKNQAALHFWEEVVEEVTKGHYVIEKDIPGVYEQGLAAAYLFEMGDA